MKSKQPQFYGATKRIFANAKALRKKSTAAEDLMWQMLRNRKVAGYKFRRQHPLKYFIAVPIAIGIYSHEALLVIEVDGSIHNLEHIKQYDQNREQEITDLGITVLRFTNDSVFSEPDAVILAIAHFLKNV